MDPTDEQLLARIADHDSDAFSAFYDRYAPRAYGLLRRMLADREDADDVLQEVFWQVWRNARQFDPRRGTVKAWLTLMTRSRALDRHRRRGREAGVGELPVQLHDPAAVDDGNEHAEQMHRARRALEGLQQEQRDAIQWAFFGGLSHSEIAARAGLPLGTVKTRIRTGMMKLREALAEGGTP